MVGRGFPRQGSRPLILADTHVLLWLDLEPERLGRSADLALKDAWEGGQLAVSAVSFWEVSMLLRERRIRLDQTASEWRAEIRGRGIVEVPLDGRAAALSEELPHLYGNPADRLILATALTTGAAFMTADRRLLDWPGELARIDAAR